MAPIVKKCPLTVMYVEVNDTNFLNVGCYTLQTPVAKQLIDIAIIFAANINYDQVNDRAVLHFNTQVTTVLRGFATYIRPLQDKGMKVLLSILGNHQGVGICNFQTIESIRDFAGQLAQTVDDYGLDGIDFDDEYAGYGPEETETGKPKPANEFSFVYLVRELRRLLPEPKIISLYYYGPVMTRLTYEDLNAGDFLDYSWNGEYGKFIVPEVPNLTQRQLGPGAVDVMVTTLEDALPLATKTMEDGYGVFLLYRLPNSDISQYLTTISEVLYSAVTEVSVNCLQSWPPTEKASADCSDTEPSA